MTYPPNLYTNSDGNIKYFLTYQGAWSRAAKLNETAENGLWYFEGDETGMWFLHFVKDGE